MIKQGILNADLRSLTARIGHRDRFAIVDAGYNIPLGIETVDLAFLPNIPSMVQVVEGIINEMAIEEVILACEIKEMSPDLDKEYAKHWPEKAKLSYIPHNYSRCANPWRFNGGFYPRRNFAKREFAL